MSFERFKKIFGISVIAILCILGVIDSIPAKESQPVVSQNSYSYSSGTTSFSVDNLCSHGSCLKPKTSGSRFCSAHTCSVSGCNREVGSSGDKCDKHKKTNSTSNSGSYKSSSSYKKSSSSSKSSSYKKYDLPDCDDYEDYDDFMDDWDGCMPGGIDAEDYWENW